MAMMTFNLALLFVLQLAALQFFFGHRENLLHRFFEFVGGFLLGRCWHGAQYAQIQFRQLGRFVRTAAPLFFGNFDEQIYRRLDFNLFVGRASEETIQSNNDVISYDELFATANSAGAFLECVPIPI